MKGKLRQMMAQGCGAIVNCSLIDGLKGSKGRSAYSASKHAVVVLTRSAAPDWSMIALSVFSQPAGIELQTWCNIMHAPYIWRFTMKAKVMPDGRLSLPAELRKRHGLLQGGEVIVEDTGDAIVLRTLDQVVARAQALSRKLVEGKTGSSVDDFLSDRTREAEAE
jgi:NAD(P)-dependent dehydrogenase (short-subunit alcohol dehydrogenase family)